MNLFRVASLSALTTAAVLAAASPPAFAQGVRAEDADLWDVIETTDGNTWKGVVIEQVPGKYYKIQLVGGTLVTVEAKKVKKMTKEANPLAAAPAPTPPPAPAPAPAPPPAGYPPPAPAGNPGPAGPPPTAAPSLPAAMARSGVRIGLGIGMLSNQGDFGDLSDGGVVFAARGGYEVLSGNFGISGGIRATYSRYDEIDIGIKFNLSSIQVQAEGRGALHMGRVVPYLGLALGYEHFIDDEDLINQFTGESIDPTGGFAFTLTLGLDVLITPSVAAGLWFALDPAAAAPYDIEGQDVPKAKRNAIGLGLSFLL